MYDLSGKIALVTGSGRHHGLGKAIALRLAREGCRVIVSDIGAAKGPQFDAAHVGQAREMAEIVAEIRAAGGHAVSLTCDVRIEAEVEAAVQGAVKEFGGLDILVNNAGIGYIMELVTDFSEANWDAVLDVNLKGAFLGIKHAARQMIAQGRGGSIVNIASQAAKSGFPYASAYTSSKHGLIGLTRATAIELGPHGIRVNAVCPNHVTTGLGAWQNEFFSKALGMTHEAYMEGMKSRIPLRRPGLQDDTANAVAFLCSPQAHYITGEAMNVSGGEEYH